VCICIIQWVVGKMLWFSLWVWFIQKIESVLNFAGEIIQFQVFFKIIVNKLTKNGKFQHNWCGLFYVIQKLTTAYIIIFYTWYNFQNILTLFELIIGMKNIYFNFLNFNKKVLYQNSWKLNTRSHYKLLLYLYNIKNT